MGNVLKRASYVAKKILGKTVAGRALTVLPDDVFLASYPRSGNTWTRFLVANLLHRDTPTSFANIEERIPEIHLFPNRWLLQRPRPRVLKSHEYFDPRYPKIIYVVRDPRDVAVSLFHYSIKRGDISEFCPIEDFVPRFVAGEFFVDFGTWGEHVSSWIFTRENTPHRFLLLRYEDMLQEPARELAKVAKFLNLEITSDSIPRAIELSSAERMRELEGSQANQWQLTKGTRPDKKFVRKAQAGGWRDELPSKSAAEIEASWGSLMRTLGYEPAFASSAPPTEMMFSESKP